MSKLLINPPEYSGLSKGKILLVILIAGIVLVGIILYGIFAADKLPVSREVTNSLYNGIGARQTINQIMQQIDDNKSKLSASALALSRSVIASAPNKPNNDMVPPIVDAEEVEAQKQAIQLKQRFKQKQSENKYASFSAKTLMFSSIVNKAVASKPDVALIANSNESQGTLAKGAATTVDLTNANSTITPARSLYELKAGSVIAATMINGINSDLPGSVIAQVRENIYDSTSRRYLLIPQGAKLIGRYDSHIIYGQERLLVAWNRLIYPNGNSITLDAIPGTDLEGYSGFHDQVDNKYWKIFGSSFIIGVITAGMQYSQNNTNANVQTGGYGSYTNPGIGQTLTGSLGQQLGQTGLAITEKNLNLQPTLIIRPNYPFNIIITADLSLQPYGKVG